MTSDRGTDERGPWWASGADDLEEVTDPLATHRAARDTPRDDARAWDVPYQDWDHRDPPPPAGSERSAFEDAMEGLQALMRFASSRRESLGGRARPHDETCRACPWCMTLRTLGDARPDVVEHLEEAMRHIVAAARSVVDAAEERTGTYESIPLDDDAPDDPLDDPLDDDDAGDDA